MVVGVDATPLLGTVTGVGQFCAGALEALAGRSDVEVAAFAVSWRRRRDLAGALGPSVRRVERPMPARPLLASWGRTAFPPIEFFTGRLDVVHGTNFTVPPARRAAEVVTVHDCTPVRFPELCQPASLRYPDLVRRAVGRGAFVHVPSTFVAEEVQELLGVPAERIGVVFHGVPTTGSRRRPPGRPSRLPSWVSRYVLALGTLEPRKDLPTLVRAMAGLVAERPGLALVLAGPDGWGSEAVHDEIARWRLGDRVVRLGWVDPLEREELLAGASVFAYPSRYEGFGFPPLEAMAAGVPVVTSNAGALAEIAGPGALQVAVGDADALGDALARLLDDPRLHGAQVVAGRRWVARYSWDACGEGLVALYRRALAARRAGTRSRSRALAVVGPPVGSAG